MKRKLGIVADCLRSEGVSSLDALEKIKAAGFEAIFTNEYRNEDVAAIKKRADELGLSYEFIHAPFFEINSLWLPGLDYLRIFNAIKESIDAAANNGVPAIILHVSSGWIPPQVNDLGLSRYDELVLYAAERGVTVAFENLRKVGNLCCLMDRYEKMSNVAYCYDNGHEHCYTETVSWMDIFRDRVVATHIHDNLGRPEDRMADYDWHLLPFEGTCDYQTMMRKLDEYVPELPLILEVGMGNPKHPKLTPDEFLATCYERIKKISEM